MTVLVTGLVTALVTGVLAALTATVAAAPATAASREPTPTTSMALGSVPRGYGFKTAYYDRVERKIQERGIAVPVRVPGLVRGLGKVTGGYVLWSEITSPSTGLPTTQYWHIGSDGAATKIAEGTYYNLYVSADGSRYGYLHQFLDGRQRGVVRASADDRVLYDRRADELALRELVEPGSVRDVPFRLRPSDGGQEEFVNNHSPDLRLVLTSYVKAAEYETNYCCNRHLIRNATTGTEIRRFAGPVFLPAGDARFVGPSEFVTEVMRENRATRTREYAVVRCTAAGRCQRVSVIARQPMRSSHPGRWELAQQRLR